MSKYHLPEDYLKPGQEFTDSLGHTWKVVQYNPAPTVIVRNQKTDKVLLGTIDSPVFSDMEFYVGDDGGSK